MEHRSGSGDFRKLRLLRSLSPKYFQTFLAYGESGSAAQGTQFHGRTHKSLRARIIRRHADTPTIAGACLVENWAVA
jgi:hypothetical protein